MGTLVWDDVLREVASRIQRFTFVVWFEPLKFVSDDGGTLRVRVPNALFRDWFALHHAATLNEALARLGRLETRVELLAGDVQEEIEQS